MRRISCGAAGFWSRATQRAASGDGAFVSAPERMTTGTAARCGDKSIADVSSQPSITGISKSMRIRAGAGFARKYSSAARPWANETTSWPSRRSNSQTSRRSMRSSSMTTIGLSPREEVAVTGSSIGSVNEKALPRPTWLSTATMPPCASTRPFVMKSPNPTPRRAS